MGLDGLITCSNCDFANPPDWDRCLMCKSPLTAPEPAADPAPAPADAPSDPDAKPVAWLECPPLDPLPLKDGQIVYVGRSAERELTLPHKEISRKHAEVRVNQGHVFVHDLGSGNGTYVNSTLIKEPTRIRPGDLVTIGPYELRIQLEEGNESVDQTAAQGVMTGLLEKIPLAEVLQNAQTHNRSGTLYVYGPQNGKVVIHQGRVLWAKIGQLRDLDALRGMLGLRKGRFALSGKEEEGEATLDLPIGGVLLRIAAMQAEAEESSEEAASEETASEETASEETASEEEEGA